ncbi:amino acid adenylation domain-containing protein [Amycolatopsis sp. NPDC057786]|uniref:non-ribosomal peptide synthetase n=1 Tax=Amycolatopsis sp. NPDC057786 TaxID=3346250 RepID=UPI00366F68BA
MSTLPVRENRTSTVAELVRHTISVNGTRAAVRHRGMTVSYAELGAAAGGIAERLRELGAGPGTVVAILVNRSPLSVMGVAAAWAVGAAYVHFESAHPDSRLAEVLALAAPVAVVVDEHNESRLPDALRDRVVVAERTAFAEYRVDPGRTPDELAYLVFTSGSSGKPKAVEVTHGAVANYLDGFRRGLGDLEIRSYGLATTFAADLGKVSVYGALLTGARLDIYDRETILDPAAFAAEIRDHPVDWTTLVPSQVEAIAGAGDLAAVLPTRAVMLAGEAFPPRLAEAILAARPDLRVYNGYGPSEATIVVTMHPVEVEPGARRVPIGLPLAGTEFLVLDEQRAEVPDGESGVLYIGGASLARGYRDDPGLTAAKFPRIGENRFYCTDDVVVRRQGGVLEYLGRADGQLKIRGHRIEPGEVEAALLALPGIRQAVVTGERTDDGPMELVAYVVGLENQAGLGRKLLEFLPPELVPSRFHLVPRIPVTVNGKVDGAELRALAERPPGPDGTPAESPESEHEHVIARVWWDVLGRADIGRNERFLESGGDSFKALAVFARLRKHYPEVTVAQLFAEPTIAALARALGGGDRAAPVPVVEL